MSPGYSLTAIGVKCRWWCSRPKVQPQIDTFFILITIKIQPQILHVLIRTASEPQEIYHPNLVIQILAAVTLATYQAIRLLMSWKVLLAVLCMA